MKKFEAAMTPEEKAKLYQAIDYQENSAPAIYPEGYVATNCVFILRSLEIEVRDDSLSSFQQRNVVLFTKLLGVNFKLQQRPAAKAVK